MPRIKVRKLTVRKHNGDDAYSYAVFEKGNPTPIVTGCSRADAKYHKSDIERMWEERERGAR